MLMNEQSSSSSYYVATAFLPATRYAPHYMLWQSHFYNLKHYTRTNQTTYVSVGENDFNYADPCKK